MNSKYTNLVFQGGSVKGIAYATALQVLESRSILDQIERVAGTSAGAITACLVSLRYDSAYITQTIKNLNFKSFEDKEWIWKKYWYYGFHPGDVFLNWLEKQIAAAPQGLSANATFADFAAKGCRDLRVFASDIYTHQVREFSVEKTPNVVVTEAVRASMSIPLFFNAWQFGNNNPDDHLYVDGGMVLNYPINTFDDGDEPNFATLGFRLADLNQRKKPDKFGYGRWLKYVKNTFETLLESQVIECAHDPEQRRRSVTLDDYGILATDFDLSEKMKDELINSGIQYTEKFLDNGN